MSLSDRPQNKSFGSRVSILNKNRRRLIKEKNMEKYYKTPKLCKHCNTTITYEQKNNIFCSSRCSATHNNRNREVTESHKQKTREAVIAHYDIIGRVKRIPHPKQINWQKYRWAKDLAESNPHTRIRLCKNCKKYHDKMNLIYCKKCSPNISHYRSRAAFTFNVYLFPLEFNLNLIDQYGWYSPTGKYGKNRKHLNLNGVSRDHLYTIADGFKNKIDPEILSHPANCDLILHTENNKKQYSSITLEALLDRIEIWNEKYGGKRRI